MTKNNNAAYILAIINDVGESDRSSDCALTRHDRRESISEMLALRGIEPTTESVQGALSGFLKDYPMNRYKSHVESEAEYKKRAEANKPKPAALSAEQLAGLSPQQRIAVANAAAAGEPIPTAVKSHSKRTAPHIDPLANPFRRMKKREAEKADPRSKLEEANRADWLRKNAEKK